jgi:DNA polymerase-3 subunit delta
LKLDARQIPGFLRDPGACRLALLYGEDEGLIRERAQALTKAVAGSLNDPFLVVELNREGWPQIPGEMAALSMIGGRRVIRVRDASDAVLPPVLEAMKGPGGALLVLEAAGLGKGKLRSFAEADPGAGCIACYPEEGRALTDLVRAAFAELRVSVDPEAVAWLGETLGGDRAVVRGEVEKLALLAGEGGRVDADMARSCAGEAAGAAGDDALSAACGGQVEAADAAIEAALADGLNGVAVMRMALMHLQKMHQARLRMATGMAASDAVRAMRPPVFFKAVAGMVSALSLWSEEGLLRAIEEARQIELACKQTGSRPELLARRYVAWLARQARARRARVGK